MQTILQHLIFLYNYNKTFSIKKKATKTTKTHLKNIK